LDSAIFGGFQPVEFAVPKMSDAKREKIGDSNLSLLPTLLAGLKDELTAKRLWHVVQFEDSKAYRYEDEKIQGQERPAHERRVGSISEDSCRLERLRRKGQDHPQSRSGAVVSASDRGIKPR